MKLPRTIRRWVLFWEVVAWYFVAGVKEAISKDIEKQAKDGK